jgi:hypothetical protein
MGDALQGRHQGPVRLGKLAVCVYTGVFSHILLLFCFAMCDKPHIRTHALAGTKAEGKVPLAQTVWIATVLDGHKRLSRAGARGSSKLALRCASDRTICRKTQLGCVEQAFLASVWPYIGRGECGEM